MDTRRNSCQSIKSEGTGEGEVSAEQFMLNTANEQLKKALRGGEMERAFDVSIQCCITDLLR